MRSSELARGLAERNLNAGRATLAPVSSGVPASKRASSEKEGELLDRRLLRQ
jgi:hypothetical protein